MYAIRDSYTGYLWCGRALHLLTPENRGRKGGCLPCLRRAAENRRERKNPNRIRRPRDRGGC